MAYNLKTKSIVVIGIIIVISSIISKSLIPNEESSKEVIFDKKNLELSTISGKIHIDNNWTAAKAAGICTGNGTYSEPYVIRNLEIDGGGGSELISRFHSGNGIHIENSDVYFRIENCSIYNCNTGMYFRNSNNNIISVNNVSNNNSGISLSYSENITISGNTANYNYYYGISLRSSNDNIVSGNTANYNNYSGIFLDGSVGNNVSGNTASYNNHFQWSMGIDLTSSNDTIISENTVDNNNYGMHLLNCNNNTIQFNIITENNIGIYLERSYSIEISDNTFNGNNVDIEEYTYTNIFESRMGMVRIVIVIITAIIFPGMLFITRKRPIKKAELKDPEISRILAIISSFICLVGGNFLTWSGMELTHVQWGFATIIVLGYGVLVIIGAISELKYQVAGSLLCLILGVITLFNYLYMDSSIYLFGTIFIIIGSIVGLIGVYNKKKK